MAIALTTMQSATISETQNDTPRDYFATKQQKTNTQAKLDGDEYFVELGKSIYNEIHANLKSRMIIMGQQIGPQMQDTKTKEDRLVQTYHDTGFAWESESLTNTAAKINTIVNSTFTET